jgi:HPt (histidine-containing phosphotransfer) domain-containing protein
MEVGAGGFASLVKLFGTQQPALIAELHRVIEDADVPTVRDKAHKLGGSCGSLGATTMRALCKQLETRARKGSLDGAAALADAIEDDFTTTNAALRAHAGLPTPVDA